MHHYLEIVEKEKLPKARTISNKFEKENSQIFKDNPRIKIDTNLKNRSPKLLKTLSEKLDDQLIICDEGIKLIISLHELCKQHLLDKNYAPSFVVLSAKMVSLMLGIRQMIYQGLSDCVKNLNRPLIESFEVFQACLIDEKLNTSFSNTEEMYDNNKFYFENFSKGKLDKQLTKLYENISLEKENVQYIESRKKAVKTFLSESIHSSFNAAFSSYLMMTVDFDIDDNLYGKITIGYPRMLLTLIEDIYIFNNVVRLSIEKNVCLDFKDISNQKGFQLYEFYSEKYDLLCNLYFEKMHNDANLYSKFIDDIKDAFEKDNDA
jgi:hypothetical protein